MPFIGLCAEYLVSSWFHVESYWNLSRLDHLEKVDHSVHFFKAIPTWSPEPLYLTTSCPSWGEEPALANLPTTTQAPIQNWPRTHGANDCRISETAGQICLSFFKVFFCSSIFVASIQKWLIGIRDGWIYICTHSHTHTLTQIIVRSGDSFPFTIYYFICPRILSACMSAAQIMQCSHMSKRVSDLLELEL